MTEIGDDEPAVGEHKAWQHFWTDHGNCGGTWVYVDDPSSPRVICSCAVIGQAEKQLGGDMPRVQFKPSAVYVQWTGDNFTEMANFVTDYSGGRWLVTTQIQTSLQVVDTKGQGGFLVAKDRYLMYFLGEWKVLDENAMHWARV